jgi:sugar lactone lactonase YvrE
MPETQPQCLWNVAAELGEGPVWVTRERSLYFVDILGCAIHRWQESGEQRSWSTPAEPGFILPRRAGGFLCGMRGGLHHFDPASGAFSILTPIEQDKPQHRINDGFADTTGRVWFGTMNHDCQTVGGALYSREIDGSLRVHDKDYVVTNGPVVSADGRTLYHTDSDRRIVYAFDLSSDGALANKRPFIEFPAGVYPDGMAVDEAGVVWVALFNGWRVESYSAQGEKLGEIRLPCANVTKPSFGGDDLRTLYITTARTGLPPKDYANQREAGGLFAIRVKTPGLPASDAY